MTKDQISTSCRKAVEQGYTIITDGWGKEATKTCCPLRACLIANGDKSDSWDSHYPAFVQDKVRKLLGISEQWITSFCAGLSNSYYESIRREFVVDPKIFKLGQDINEHYIQKRQW
jgi:hypothetical protein